jgi:hypothetical protein
MRVRKKPIEAQTPQRRPHHRHPAWDAISCPQRTDGQKGMIVKIKTATYFPRLEVGASSDVAASAVSSLIPAPIPAIAMPPISSVSCVMRAFQRNMLPINVFIVCAVELTAIPIMMKRPPINARYRRPMRSERDPTNGQTPASASKLASTNQIQLKGQDVSCFRVNGHRKGTYRSTPPISA